MGSRGKYTAYRLSRIIWTILEISPNDLHLYLVYIAVAGDSKPRYSAKTHIMHVIIIALFDNSAPSPRA